MYKEINIHADVSLGVAKGFICDEHSSKFIEWFENTHMSPYILDRFDALYCFLDEIYIPVFNRNVGLGNDLMESFLKRAEIERASCIILECNQGDNTFNLKRWYESFDFTLIDDSSVVNHYGCPLMIKLID